MSEKNSFSGGASPEEAVPGKKDVGRNRTDGVQKRRTGRGIRVLAAVCVCIGVLGLLSGLLLAGYNLYDDRRAGVEMQKALTVLQKTLPPSVEKDAAGSSEGVQPPENDGAELPVIPDYLLNPEMEMPTVEIDGHLYIGTVVVPAIELELPVIDHWSEADKKLLKIAPCRYVGTPYQKNMIIAGHNYTTHFGRLKNLQPGDLVTFTDVDGNIFRYRVTMLETLPGTAIEEMKSGDYDLTLFTCTIGGVSRVTVRCKEEPEDPQAPPAALPGT